MITQYGTRRAGQRTFFLLINMCALMFSAFAAAPPDWFLPLRDAVYEQKLTANEIALLYRTTLHTVETRLSGYERSTALSRCEYMMGRALQYENRKEEAAACYEKGMDWAKKSLAEQPTAEGYQMLAENISQSCAVRSTAWAIANGLKVEQYAKEALKIDPQNAAAQYMIAARYVFAPAPFHNYNRGLRMMQEIADETKANLQKDDRFNVYSAIGYAYIQQKKFTDARPWLEKALAVYPSNQFVRGLLEQKK
ncbi:MAG: tetratricopeptide repeat protein [Treponema sp.]|jgi:tetratricopeptide (TPR) repeat protein|nr:tetratricopeptide repeat protein [Treponema sp.]